MSINISELIWTIICFFALLFILRKLLFEPVSRHMDQRQSRIDAGLGEIRRAEEATEAARRAVDERWQERSEEARRLVNHGRERDEEERAAALEESRRLAALSLAQAREDARREEERTRKIVSERGEELARALADHLLRGGEKG